MDLRPAKTIDFLLFNFHFFYVLKRTKCLMSYASYTIIRLLSSLYLEDVTLYVANTKTCWSLTKDVYISMDLSVQTFSYYSTRISPII